MDFDNMFKMAVRGDENTKSYPDYEIPLEILHVILKAGTDIKVHKKYSSIKNKLCMMHVCGSINSLPTCYQNIAYDIIFGYWKLSLSYHVQRNEVLKKFEDVRYKNMNKLIKGIKYHDKGNYNKYIKSIIRNINRPPQINFKIRNFDVNVGSDPSVVINLNAFDKTGTIEKLLSELSGSFRIIKNTNVVITQNDGFIRFAPYSEIYKTLCLIKEKFKHQYKSIKDAFEKHKDKFIVSDVRFMNLNKNVNTNNNDILYTFNGYKYQDDDYTPRNYLAIKKCTEGCRTFFTMIKSMFHNAREYEYFKKYLAWVIQNPGRRSEIIPVLYSNTNVSYFLEILVKILGYYALSVSTSIYDKIKHDNTSDLMGLTLVVIDDDLNNSEDITNIGTKYDYKTHEHYKPNYKFLKLIKSEKLNLKVNKTHLDFDNVTNFIIKTKHLDEFKITSVSNNIYFIPRLNVSNIFVKGSIFDMFLKDIYGRYNTCIYQRIINHFKNIPLDGFDIKNIPMNICINRQYNVSVLNPIEILIGVLAPCFNNCERIPMKILQTMIYEIAFEKANRMIFYLSSIDQKPLECNCLSLEYDKIIEYLYRKFDCVDVNKIISKLSVYFAPAGYSSLSKWIQQCDKLGYVSYYVKNRNVNINKSEKCVKLNDKLKDLITKLTIKPFVKQV